MKAVYGLLCFIIFNIVSMYPLGQQRDLIKRIKVHKNRIDVIIDEDFKKKYLRDDFFIEYDTEINLEDLDYSIVTLPFIMNVMSLVWISGEEYTIEAMDKNIYKALEQIKKLFNAFYPATPWNGRLIPRTLTENKYRIPHTGKVALLFSGGLDSISSSYAHSDKQQLLITAWGQSSLPLSEPELWRHIKSHVENFASKQGALNSYIKSNYYYFLNLKRLRSLSPEISFWRIDTIEDIGWAGMLIPLLIKKQINNVVIAASETWGFDYPTAANPYIDALLSCNGITIKHDQFDLSRFDKLKFLISACKHTEKPQFVVCQKRGNIINCNRCEKCLMTIIGLFCLQENPQQYGFDTTYKQAQENMVALYESKTLSETSIWQFKDMQKKMGQFPQNRYDMLWFKQLPFNQKKAHDIKKDARKVNWSLIAALFPEIQVLPQSMNL